jgi:hypothetical protein
VKIAQKRKPEARESTSIKGTGLSNFGDNSHVAAVDIKDGKIIRIRPQACGWIEYYMEVKRNNESTGY